MSTKRVLIVGGVAGGASCAARLRRMDEQAEIFIFERTGDVSFANCGLPYYIGGAIADRKRLLVATPERFRDFFNIEVRTRHEVRSIDRQNQTIEVRKSRHRGHGRRALRRPGARPRRRAGAAAAAGHRPAGHLHRPQHGRHRSDLRLDRPSSDRPRGRRRRRLHRSGNGRKPQPSRHHRHAAGACRSGHAASRREMVAPDPRRN